MWLSFILGQGGIKTRWNTCNGRIPSNVSSVLLMCENHVPFARVNTMHIHPIKWGLKCYSSNLFPMVFAIFGMEKTLELWGERERGGGGVGIRDVEGLNWTVYWHKENLSQQSILSGHLMLFWLDQGSGIRGEQNLLLFSTYITTCKELLSIQFRDVVATDMVLCLYRKWD